MSSKNKLISYTGKAQDFFFMDGKAITINFVGISYALCRHIISLWVNSSVKLYTLIHTILKSE